ncbi:eukaryotic and archaeal DNA primase, large subunit-domain-containing protein, partial [Obelidium mucronatum]
FPFRLNFYQSLPTDELALADFETCALDRLKVLKAIENAAVRNKSAEDTAAIIKASCEKYLPLEANIAKGSIGEAALEAQRRKDHQSHFILRLAFCRTEDNRAWFLKHETLLFKYRYESEYITDRLSFLKLQSLDSIAISKQERDSIASDLNALFGNTDQKFYKVPFEQVLALVSRRAVVLKNGFAYVPESEQATLVTNAFKNALSSSLESFSRALPRMDEDDRLIPILNSIARQCAMRDYGLATEGNGINLTAQDVDNLVPQGHFPLCMSNLHLHLKADAHLKHSGRLQFGLFLKGTGLPLEEALVYWRKAFHKLTDDKFQKEYAYNIRFNYGQEGSRKDYAPYSCSKIITSNHPGAGDHHGCPFRHANPEVLRSMVVKAGCGEATAVDVLRMAKEGHYQIACTKLFEVTRA